MDLDSVHLAQRPAPVAADGSTATAAANQTSGPESFVGSLQHVLFKGQNLVEMARTGDNVNIRTNARFIDDDETITYPMTFHTPNAYLVLNHNLKNTYAIYFNLRTTQLHGLIMYSGNERTNDFMAVELHNGKLRFIFDVGNGPEVIRSNLARPINDNQWHTVAIVRPSLTQHILRVDNDSDTFNMAHVNSISLDTDPDFYIGGVPDRIFEQLPDKVKSKNGYQGCLSSINLEREPRNILEWVTVDAQYRDLITAGCQGR